MDNKMIKVKDLIENVYDVKYASVNEGDYIAININDNVNSVSIAGIAGNTEDFYDKDYLPKGKYIILQATKELEIKC
tara:strand:- start:222 stop:452 length:231 start_codon:yes stop_codon:yes gene_type:complete